MQKRRLKELKEMENTQVKFSSPKSPLPDDNQNQNHNSRKESLGPNTKR